MNTIENEKEIDLIEVFMWLRQKLWLILLAALLGGIAAFAVTTYMMSPVYTSTAELHIVNNQQDTNQVVLSDLQVSTQLVYDYVKIIKGRTTISQVIDELNLDLTYEQLRGRISVENPEKTRLIDISVKYGNPQTAKQIADTLARAAAVRISEVMNTEEPSIVEEANFPEHKSGPSLKKNMLIGILLGAIVTAGIIVLKNLLDDRIKTADDIEKYLGLTTLCILPVISKKADKNGHKGGHHE